MTVRPKTPTDLLLAPVAVELDLNLAPMRDASAAEIDFHIALKLDRPELTGSVDERIERVLEVAVRNVELHHWIPTIVEDHSRLRLTGGSVSLDVGLGANVMRYIDAGK